MCMKIRCDENCTKFFGNERCLSCFLLRESKEKKSDWCNISVCSKYKNFGILFFERGIIFVSMEQLHHQQKKLLQHKTIIPPGVII